LYRRYVSSKSLFSGICIISPNDFCIPSMNHEWLLYSCNKVMILVIQIIGRRSLLGCSCKNLWSCSSPWRWEILNFIFSLLKIHHGVWNCGWFIWRMYIE
jgi:hypothetical protein